MYVTSFLAAFSLSAAFICSSLADVGGGLVSSVDDDDGRTSADETTIGAVDEVMVGPVDEDSDGLNTATDGSPTDEDGGGAFVDEDGDDGFSSIGSLSEVGTVSISCECGVIQYHPLVCGHITTRITV